MDFGSSSMDKRQRRVQQRRLRSLSRKEEKLLAEKEPSLLSKKVVEVTAPVRETIRQKLPEKAVEKSAELLQKAFAKSFDLVLEQGASLIGKTCGEKKRLERYEQFAAKPLSSWELTRLGTSVAAKAGANMVFSTVQGGAMGALGIGIPDVPIFMAAVFKTLFEISLSFGYPYDTPDEQTYQLLLICAALGDEAERRLSNADADQTALEIQMGIPTSIGREDAKQRAAAALCRAALAGKMIQGTPLIGVYGGFKNGVILQKIAALAATKYQQRMLRFI